MICQQENHINQPPYIYIYIVVRLLVFQETQVQISLGSICQGGNFFIILSSGRQSHYMVHLGEAWKINHSDWNWVNRTVQKPSVFCGSKKSRYHDKGFEHISLVQKLLITLDYGISPRNCNYSLLQHSCSINYRLALWVLNVPEQVSATEIR